MLVSPRIGELRSCMANRLVCVRGTITKLGSPHLVEYKQQFECNRCHSRFEVDIDVHAGGHVQLPEVCPNDSTGRRKRRRHSNNQSMSGSQSQAEDSSPGCQGTNFTRCAENQFHKDCQEIRLQELSGEGTSSSASETRGSVGGGSKHKAKSITVRLEDDFVDRFSPGDDIEVTGVLMRHWRKIGRVEMQCEVELVINAVHVGHIKKDRNALAKASLALPPASAAETQDGLLPPANRSESEAATGGEPCARDWASTHWKKYASMPIAGRNFIVNSLAPQVHGLFTAKLAVMLVLCGGVAIQGGNRQQALKERTGNAAGRSQQNQNQNHTVRGECHLLLAGDPGTGKSQLMRCAARISKRSVVTNGRGSTNAGLTATAVVSRSGGMSSGGVLSGGTSGGKMSKGGKSSEWTLEAGALVLADGGICCIDEFETMREADRAAIHEAMEQQTLSIAKAGLVTKLRSQTAIIASTNIKKQKAGKKQNFDPFTVGFDESMVNISAPLLSRFDLVLTVRDLSSKQWDAVIADHVLDQHHQNDLMSCEEEEELHPDYSKEQHWSEQQLKEYVLYVKTLQPVLTRDAEEMLKWYYQKQRQLVANKRQSVDSRTTIRMLESLVRLAQAHARLMAHDQVRVQDAVATISLMEASMSGLQNVTQSLAPKEPDMDYQRMEEMILNQAKQQQQERLLYV